MASYGGMGSFGGVMTMSKMPSRILVGTAVFELVLAAGFGVLAVVLPAEARPGMIITAAVLGVVGIVLLKIGMRAAARFAEAERLRSSGLDGTATIVELSQTNMYMNGQPQVAMGLQVTVPGREPYTVQLKEFVPLIFLGALTAGVPLPVKADPANLQKVLIDWQHIGTAPARGPGPTQQAVVGKDVAATPELLRQSASAGMLPSESELEYQRTRLRQFGKPGTAVVQSAQDTGMTVGRYKVFVVDLVLTVEGQTKDIMASAAAVPPEYADRAAAGMVVPIRIDTVEPDDMTILWEEAKRPTL